jgi:hypothetical protein
MANLKLHLMATDLTTVKGGTRSSNAKDVMTQSHNQIASNTNNLTEYSSILSNQVNEEDIANSEWLESSPADSITKAMCKTISIR